MGVLSPQHQYQLAAHCSRGVVGDFKKFKTRVGRSVYILIDLSIFVRIIGIKILIERCVSFSDIIIIPQTRPENHHDATDKLVS